MRKTLHILTVCCGFLLLTSCFGVSKMDTTTYTDVVLSKNNYKIIGPVKGYYNTYYIFGLGGLSSNALKDNAANDMFNNAKLKDGQAVININYSSSIAYHFFGVLIEKSVEANGTIIEFTE